MVIRGPGKNHTNNRGKSAARTLGSLESFGRGIQNVRLPYISAPRSERIAIRVLKEGNDWVRDDFGHGAID